MLLFCCDFHTHARVQVTIKESTGRLSRGFPRENFHIPGSALQLYRFQCERLLRRSLPSWKDSQVQVTKRLSIEKEKTDYQFTIKSALSLYFCTICSDPLPPLTPGKGKWKTKLKPVGCLINLKLGKVCSSNIFFHLPIGIYLLKDSWVFGPESLLFWSETGYLIFAYKNLLFLAFCYWISLILWSAFFIIYHTVSNKGIISFDNSSTFLMTLCIC